jgi:hypothetical protein
MSSYMQANVNSSLLLCLTFSHVYLKLLQLNCTFHYNYVKKKKQRKRNAYVYNK